MIQSKNKFLPPLYIRKCKITYLECFAILQRAGCYGQLLLVFESMTLHLHTAHGCVRVHGWVGMEGWAGGWVGGGMNEDQAGALWGTQKKEHRPQEGGRTQCCWADWHRSQRADWRRKEPTDAVSALPCVSDSGISAEVKRKQKPKLTEQNSCPQHQLPEEMLSWGFGFHLLVWKFKSVHPIELRVGQRNKLQAATHTFLYSSLENTSAISYG